MKTSIWPAKYRSVRGNWVGVLTDNTGTIEYFARAETEDDVQDVLDAAVIAIQTRKARSLLR